MAEQLANNAASTLNGGIDNVVTSLTVANGAVFPATGNFRILIDSEILLCTARAANVLTVTRAQETTSAASHSNGAAVTQVLTKGGLLQFINDNARFLGVRVLTTTGTYTPTAGTTRVYVECIGGGGGGGGSAANTGAQASAAAGGGGGAYAASFLTSGFSGVGYVIGAVGAAGTAGNNPGGAGGDTTFNVTTIVAKGGGGGSGGAAITPPSVSSTAGGGGGAASGSTGDLKISGAPGTPGLALSTASNMSGNGGMAPHGGGGGLGQVGGNATGSVGSNYGGGGGGGLGIASGAAQAGGAGATGLIRIWEFAS